MIAEVDRIGIPTETVVRKKCAFVFNNSFFKDPNAFCGSYWGTDRRGCQEDNFLTEERQVRHTRGSI